MNDAIATASRPAWVQRRSRLSVMDRRQPRTGLPHPGAAAPFRTAGPTPSVTLAARRPDPSVIRLSRRERDVLELLAEGYSTRDIAQRLCYSERTIKNVVQNLTTRLHARNRTHVVAYALRHGWI